MKLRNIASVSWSDHLVFGSGDGRLATPDSLRIRMREWRERLGAGIVHWKCSRSRIRGRVSAAKGHGDYFLSGRPEIKWDDFMVVPQLAREMGMNAHLSVTVFDEGWPLAPSEVRAVSYHNAMYGKHVSFQSEFSRAHPEYLLTNRTGTHPQWGVLCLAYPEVRRHLIRRFDGLLGSGLFDGLFVCLRSQSRPAEFADEFGFNEPIRQDYLVRYGRDIRTRNFDMQAWRNLMGEYLTRFLVELRSEVSRRGIPLGVGVPRGIVLGPPLGNTTLEWRKWAKTGIVDYLVVGQNSSMCPCLGLDLWPMHRGYGYVQCYLDDFNMPPLHEHLRRAYGPVLARSGVELYVARQWDERSPDEERELLDHPEVTGLVLGTFRFDNPGAVAGAAGTR